MAFVVGSGAYATLVSVSGLFATYSFFVDWTGNDGYVLRPKEIYVFENGGNIVSWSWNTGNDTSYSGYYYSSLAGNPTNIPLDGNITWYGSVRQIGVGYTNSSVFAFKSYALPPSASTPTVGSITSSGATVSVNYVPNTFRSTATAQLQYKRTVDAVWTPFGSSGTGSGYGTASLSGVALTGLTGSTQYDVRVVLTRNTANDTSYTGPTSSFTTLPGEPEITTDPASSVSATSAILNATLTINAGTGVQVYWMWDTVSPPVANTTAAQAASGSGSFTHSLSGLSPSTPYYARAYTTFSTPSGSPNNGAIVSFTTPASPLAAAAQEDHMHIYNYDGKYGAQTDIYFTLSAPAGTSSDRLVTTAPGTLFTAGDIKVSKDGGAFANVLNSVSQVAGSNPLYKLVLDATEMQAELVIVQIVDQDGPAFRDQIWIIRTKLRLGQLLVDASALTNSSAAVFTGVGTGHGLEAVGGATGMDINGVLGEHVLRTGTAQAGGASTITLDGSASGTNDYYNGAIVMLIENTGAGQARVITDYVGSTKIATVNKAWATNPGATTRFIIIGGPDGWAISPGAELAALPTFASNYADMLQFLFQRFVYKRTQTATVFTMYKDDGTTSFATAGVSDNGTTETHNELS